MRVLALETSSKLASIAICEFKTGFENQAPGGTAFRIDPAVNIPFSAEIYLPRDARTTQTLIPSIKSLLSEHNWPISSLDLIVTPLGPGSFTGLRIGITTAKTMAYALGCSVCGVQTLQLAAASFLSQPPESDSGFHQLTNAGPNKLVTVMDAQRSGLFFQSHTFNGLGFESDEQVNIVRQDNLGRLLDGNSIICCTEQRSFEAVEKSKKNGDVPDLTPLIVQLSPVVLAELGVQSPILSGDDVFRLSPSYYRKSAAEEQIAPN